MSRYYFMFITPFIILAAILIDQLVVLYEISSISTGIRTTIIVVKFFDVLGSGIKR